MTGKLPPRFSKPNVLHLLDFLPGSPVETSAFNAEAPTEPAGETVGCRRQLGGIVRLILYDFVKSLSHFFVSKKNDSSLGEGDFGGQGRALSLRYDIEFNLTVTVSYQISVNYFGGSKPPPYTVGC